MNKTRKQKKLQPVHIVFWDHISGSAEELEADGGVIEVFGVIYKETKLAYYVASWVCDSEINTANTDAYKILKSTIIGMRRLR